MWSDDKCQYDRYNRKSVNMQYTKNISFSIWDDKVIVTCKIGLWWSYQSLDEKQECKFLRRISDQILKCIVRTRELHQGRRSCSHIHHLQNAIMYTVQSKQVNIVIQIFVIKSEKKYLIAWKQTFSYKKNKQKTIIIV